MLIGLGLDLVDISTITLAIARDSTCAASWCTEAELQALGPRASDAKSVAGRIAAKEAVAKALGVGFAGDVAWQDIEIVPTPTGSVAVQLSGGAYEAAKVLGATRVLVSLSHTNTTAAACAVALGSQP